MKIKFLLSFTLFFSLIFITSCGELTGGSTGARDLFFGSQDSLIGGVSAVEVAPEKYLLSGVTSNGGNSSHGFELHFKIDVGEEITFFFYANAALENGIAFTFKRTDSSLFAVIKKDELVHEYELPQLAGLSEIHLDLDLHNDHSDIHFLFWEHSGAHEDSDECSFEGGCLYNSEDFALDFWLGVGRASGTYWGFKGKRSNIISLKGPGRALSNV